MAVFTSRSTDGLMDDGYHADLIDSTVLLARDVARDRQFCAGDSN